MLAADIIGLSAIKERCVPITQPESVAPIMGNNNGAAESGLATGNATNACSMGIIIGNIRPIVAQAEPINAAIIAAIIKQSAGKAGMVTINPKRCAI